MALTFVYGNSGNGKSEYMYRKIASEAERSPYRHYFVLVPEQFNLSAQRKLVGCSSSGVIMNIDVCSFERLAWRVFDELGVHRTVMEETGKSLVLRRIAEENESKLTVLRSSLTKMGYIGELKSVISELMQYGISPDDLENFIGELPDGYALSYKLRDILQIYRSFDEYLRDGYVTAERVTGLLTEVAGESSILRNAVFLFDGYTGFTPVQTDLIGRLMHIASDIYVTVTIDAGEPLYKPVQQEELFYMSRRMVASLSRAAEKAAFGIADPVRIDAHEKSRFHDNPVLSHLEGNLFRIPGGVFEGPCGDRLRIVSLLSPRDELRFAAAGIRTLVREKGYRWRDCAIVCPDVESYAKYADGIFDIYGIPAFVDKKQSVLCHPLTELVRSVPEIADTDYSIESVFRYLRTGLAGFEPEEVDRLENYCIAKGIRGARRWKKEFDSLPGNGGRYEGERAAAELAELNGLRQRFFDGTKETIAVFRKKKVTVRERTEALYGLIYSLDAEGKLCRGTERFEQKGDEVSASVNRQIYRIVIDLLDKMADLLGDELIPSSEYADILESGFESARVGTIPPGNDCVIMGDTERTRLDEIRVLFLLGANDGAIPKKSARQSILSENDRKIMMEHDLELSPGAREQMFLQRFYLYLALTKPSDSLCVTYSRMGSDGKAVRPSYLVATLENMFSGLRTEESAADDMMPFVTPAAGVESWMAGLTASDRGAVSPEWKALHRWYTEDPVWKERISRLFDTHFSVYEKKDLGAAAARALYGEVLLNSFTKLDSFGECPYKYFLRYGLKLADRKEFTFTSIEMGTLFHLVLRKYCTAMDEADGWKNADEEREEGLLREAIGSAVGEQCEPELFESATGSYDLERVYRIMKRSSWALTEQIRRGNFLPEGYEVEIDSEITGGGPGASARLSGKIDRMDVCEEDGRVSVRVFDYKSGNKELEFSNIYHGRDLQLPVYLYSATEYLKEKYPGREIVPAGIFYFHMDDPMIDVDDESKGTRDSCTKLLREMRPDGFFIDDVSVVRQMDRTLERSGDSDVVRVSLRNDGNINGRCGGKLSAGGFEDLMSYVRLIMEETSCRMSEGVIDVSPYRAKEKSTGCSYCRFGGVCGFDPKIPGYAYREEKNLGKDKAMELMRERLGEENE